MENSNYENNKIERKYSNTWYDWLIKYIPKSITKIVGAFKDKVVSLFNKNTLNKPWQTWDRNETKQTKNTKAI